MAQKPNNAKTLKRVADALAVIAASAVFHSTAILLIFAVLLLPFLGGGRLSLLADFLLIPDFLRATTPALLAHLVLASSLWALLYSGWLGWSRRSKGPRSLRVARGTVITETLIVMPVLLMLILGLAQLAINTATGVLANLAAYQTARTVWIWHPEMNRFPGEVDEDRVREMARIQAAAVLTPVAPSYGTLNNADTSPQFRQLRGALVASQLDLGVGDAGSTGIDLANDVSTMGYNLYRDEGLSMAGALDGASFPVRTALKFSGAYVSSSVEIIEVSFNEDGLPEIGAHLTYRHIQALPLVGRLFGEPDTVYDRSGFFVEYDRQFTMVRQLNPHSGHP